MSEENQNRTVVYGSDDYYEQTGQNGTTLNNKPASPTHYYNAELYFWENYHNRLKYNNTTYENMFYRDENGKDHLWHRKRINKHIILPGGHIIYPDAMVYLELYKPRNYSTRHLTYEGMINGKVYYTVIGSLKFDDNENLYLADSEDGIIINSRRLLRGEKGIFNYNYISSNFQSNQKNKLGFFKEVFYREEDDPEYQGSQPPLRTKIISRNFDGINYKIDTVVRDLYGDGPAIPTDDRWLGLYTKGCVDHVISVFRYPLYIVAYMMNRTYNYEDSENEHKFAQYDGYAFNYFWYRIYNDNTKTFIDLPFITDVSQINSKWSGGVTLLVSPSNFSLSFLKSICIYPKFSIVGVCPNGNILISITYYTTRSVDTKRFPEYSNFSGFYATPQFYVIDYSGELHKSNIKESYDIYIESYNYELPKYLYTSDEYLWFRKPYLEKQDITFYGTKDGYNIDKRITYYNRHDFPYRYHNMYDDSAFDGTIQNGYLNEDHFFSVPLFENGKFVKNMVGVWLGNDWPYTGHVLVSDDLTPNSSGIFETDIFKLGVGSSYLDQNRYVVRQSRKQPGQTDDEYVYNIE